jgi:light-regulated signal transduction histidine kinase (bacteriophytochrome)
LVRSDIYHAQYGRPPESDSALKWWTDRVHPEERDRVLASLNAALEGSKDAWASEYHLQRADGSWAYVHNHSRISRDGSGKPVRLVGGVLDLTARKKLEEVLKQTNAELETVNKELESFSYAVANDLRTPLRSIEGFSRAILEDYAGMLDDTGKDFCRRIQDATLRMTQLIEALWTMSRLTSGELAENVVDLSAVSHIIALELKKRQPERRVDFIIAEGLKVKGDTDMMRVVLENLLDNAWKFTGRHPSATIEFGIIERDGTRAYFVRDDGAGFNIAFVDRLFRPFQRLHTDSEFPGIGIGLAIAATIIKRHGGRIWAEGQVEKGATFFFTL